MKLGLPKWIYTGTLEIGFLLLVVAVCDSSWNLMKALQKRKEGKLFISFLIVKYRWKVTLSARASKLIISSRYSEIQDSCSGSLQIKQM